MRRLGELLLCRADIHIYVLDDNGDMATIMAAKMNDASVAMLMLGARRSLTVIGELGLMLAERADVHEMTKYTVPLLSPDTMSTTDAEGNTPLLCSIIPHHYCVMGLMLQSCVPLTYLCSGREAVDRSTACTISTVVKALTYLMSSLLAD